MKCFRIGALVVLAVELFTLRNASAITLPDSGSCGDSAKCLEITNTSTGSAIWAYGTTGTNQAVILAVNQPGSFGNALVGTASRGIGVNGASTYGNGIQGFSAASNGVYATTNANTVGVAAGYFTTSAGSGSTALVADNGSAGTGLYAHSSSGYAGYFAGTTNVQGCFQVNGNNEFGCSSDRRLKQNIEPLANSLDTLLRLKGVTFDWKKPEEHGKDGGNKQIGFIAQDVAAVFPRWVGENQDGFKTLTIPATEMAALEVESIRALKADNDDLRARIQVLEAARRPGSLTNAGGFGFGVAGLAIAGALVVVRRKREQDDL